MSDDVGNKIEAFLLKRHSLSTNDTVEDLMRYTYKFASVYFLFVRKQTYFNYHIYYYY